ncbi:MAG: hypothetical protein D6772_10455, partial [Bacteroidetes bacterium]
MSGLINRLVAAYLRRRMTHIRRMHTEGPHIQARVFQQLIRNGERTVWGDKYAYRDIETIAQFQQRVPVQEYDDLAPYFRRMLLGERSVLWPGRTRHFAKSAGTTKDKSKFIPISRQNLLGCHIKGTWDTMATYYDN